MHPQATGQISSAKSKQKIFLLLSCTAALSYALKKSVLKLRNPHLRLTTKVIENLQNTQAA